MKTITGFVLAALATMALVPATALAQDEGNIGYARDPSGQIVNNATGLCWHTGEWTPAMAIARCEPGYQPVAAAPAPAPKPAVVAAAPVIVAPPARPAAIAQAPAKPLSEKMSFSSDALFAFDKAELKPEGKTMLDGLVRQISASGSTYETILATGHADRLGSTDYNQNLSVRRANAVRDYLVSREVPATRIDAAGKGEMQPVTKAGECVGAKSAKLIACLQPDRRVDVEMTGTKTIASSR